jgi:hypothetical protein
MRELNRIWNLEFEKLQNTLALQTLLFRFFDLSDIQYGYGEYMAIWSARHFFNFKTIMWSHDNLW